MTNKNIMRKKYEISWVKHCFLPFSIFVLKVLDQGKGHFIYTSNLKIHLAIKVSSTETAEPALP